VAEEVYDVIICGAGSGGGFLAGEIAPYGSVLILDAGPHLGGAPNHGVGSPERRRAATQINLGTYHPDNPFFNRGNLFFAYPMYMIEANPINASVAREARVVGGGSLINVGAWVRPRSVDWDGFVEETGVQGWTKEAFEPHFRKAEQVLHVHRDPRSSWNKASVLYEQAANSLGIPTHMVASNRFRCIFCGHRLNAGMPCKYDALMSTAITQIPKALSFGAKLEADATVASVLVENNRAVGVTYIKEREAITVRARKLVVLSAGAIGTPLIMRSSGLHHINDNVGRYLRAHPGVPLDVLLPGDDWNSDRGYQWNVAHYTTDENGEPIDVLAFASASFPSNTPWVAASVGFFGKPYKDLMRRFRQRAGAFLFEMKPTSAGRVVGTVEGPEVFYPVVDKSGFLEPKMMDDFIRSVRQVNEIYGQMGAITSFPAADTPPAILKQLLTLFVTTTGAIHSQGTCRAGADPATSVCDTNCMMHGLDGLMCCDASVIPHHISSNPNSLIMALAHRASEFVITQVLGRAIDPTFHVNLPEPPHVDEAFAAGVAV
jgi:choline dehydrogenase-like flavoprotein